MRKVIVTTSDKDCITYFIRICPTPRSDKQSIESSRAADAANSLPISDRALSRHNLLD